MSLTTAEAGEDNSSFNVMQMYATLHGEALAPIQEEKSLTE
jgi:hypothetical protein